MFNSVLTVVTPASDQSMTTLDAVKDELGITNSAADLRLQRWITAASGQIRSYTRRFWAQEAVVETFYRPGSQIGSPLGVSILPPLVSLPLRFGSQEALRLARYPLQPPTQVVEDGLVIDPSGYLLDTENGLLYRLDVNGFPCRWGASFTEVDYIGGYSPMPDALPAEVQQACINLVKANYFSARRDPSLRSINIPGVQEEAYWVGQRGDSALPPEIAALLDPYREIHV